MTQTNPVGRPRLYPFPAMKVGDSFLVGRDKAYSAARAAYNYGVKTRRRFSAARVDGGARIWRVK